jgi:hypothetical protein
VATVLSDGTSQAEIPVSDASLGRAHQITVLAYCDQDQLRQRPHHGGRDVQTPAMPPHSPVSIPLNLLYAPVI